MEEKDIQPSLEGQYILDVCQGQREMGCFYLRNINTHNAICYTFNLDTIPAEQKEMLEYICEHCYEKEHIFLGQEVKYIGYMESGGSRVAEYLHFKNMSNGKDYTMSFHCSLVFRLDIINDELVGFITQYCETQKTQDIWNRYNKNIFLISPSSRAKSARSVIHKLNEDDNPSPSKKQKTK